MKKYVLDLKVTSTTRPHERYVLLKLTHENPLPEMLPGQFAELKVDGSPSTFLRRPISINYIDRERNEVWFLIQMVGDGTRKLAELKPGVGTAPMLYLGKTLVDAGIKPTFLLGARSAKDLLEIDLFQELGDVYLTTEDGSAGEQGFVTQHSILTQQKFDRIATCGPKPMMMAVAKFARNSGITCEVSLENTMACGVGACLCCVENTKEGHVCVCKEGPVFNIDRLLWQI